MHGRQWARGVQACRRKPEQGLRDGTAAGSAAADAGAPPRERRTPWRAGAGGRPLALAGREGVGRRAVGGVARGASWPGGVGTRGAAREIDPTGAAEGKKGDCQGDRGQMALSPGPQTLKSLPRWHLGVPLASSPIAPGEVCTNPKRPALGVPFAYIMKRCHSPVGPECSWWSVEPLKQVAGTPQEHKDWRVGEEPLNSVGIYIYIIYGGRPVMGCLPPKLYLSLYIHGNEHKTLLERPDGPRPGSKWRNELLVPLPL